MNDHTPTGPTDDDVVARLRNALDELTAESDERLAFPTPATPHAMGTGRWLAVAAAAVLIVAAVVAIAANLGNRGDTPAADNPTTVSADANTTEPVLIPSGAGSWYVIDSSDLIPGALVTEECCPPMPAPGPITVVAWGATTGVQDGLLVLRAEPTIGGVPTLSYSASGFASPRAHELMDEVQPGSGLPYVLDDDGVALLGSGFENIGNLASQTYTNGDGSVTISVGDYRGQLAELAHDDFDAVTVAGLPGFRWVDESSGVHVVWQAPNGQWALVDIAPALFSSADEILAGISSSALPEITHIPAVTAPETSG